jgi:(S)-ureidoglycine aminohydrolase
MKSTLFAAFVGIALLAKYTTLSPGDPIQSDVYTWKNLPLEKRETSERRQILEGVAAVFSNMEIHATTIEPGKAAHAPHKHAEEEMLIVKEGKIKMTIGDKSQVLGPGSVAISMPGDEHSAVNVGDTKATYYILKYISKEPADDKRSKDAGGSFMVNWDNVKFNPHDKGGIRRFFERPTTMAKRIEMHVTTLNTGLKSHDPHTHKAEEIVLMVEGNGEMQIGDKIKKVAPGDLIYLASNVLHAIRNDDSKPITYFAFQFD